MQGQRNFAFFLGSSAWRILLGRIGVSTAIRNVVETAFVLAYVTYAVWTVRAARVSKRPSPTPRASTGRDEPPTNFPLIAQLVLLVAPSSAARS